MDLLDFFIILIQFPLVLISPKLKSLTHGSLVILDMNKKILVKSTKNQTRELGNSPPLLPVYLLIIRLECVVFTG